MEASHAEVEKEPKYYQFVYSWNQGPYRTIYRWDVKINGTITKT